MTQPIDHISDIAAARVARSGWLTRSIAKAVKIGLPAFISEFRTAIAAMTVQSTGLKPRTTRKGMLMPWTMTTDFTRPKRRASVGWYRTASIVPMLVSGTAPVIDARTKADF